MGDKPLVSSSEQGVLTLARDRRDVIFDQYWYSMQRTSRTLQFSFDVQCLGLLERAWVRLDYSPQNGPLKVDLVDASEVRLSSRSA